MGRTLQVEDKLIRLVTVSDEDYISLTDMARDQSGDLVKAWLRNKSTLEFLAVWETLSNPGFNSVEFDRIRLEAGSNRFTISVKEWVGKTGAMGVIARTGRYGGTYAHKDIALEFAAWISPVFRLYLVKEFERLKAQESSRYNLEWNVRRVLTKINYKAHTDSIKEYIIPRLNIAKDRQKYVYADEADILNLALFGCTAADWRLANPTAAKEGRNIRDIASINELTVLANMETLNASFIEEGHEKHDRLLRLHEYARKQLTRLDGEDFIRSLKQETGLTEQRNMKRLDAPEGPSVED